MRIVSLVAPGWCRYRGDWPPADGCANGVVYETGYVGRAARLSGSSVSYLKVTQAGAPDLSGLDAFGLNRGPGGVERDTTLMAWDTPIVVACALPGWGTAAVVAGCSWSVMMQPALSKPGRVDQHCVPECMGAPRCNLLEISGWVRIYRNGEVVAQLMSENYRS